VVTGRFTLSDINGRSLPTYQAATPGLTAMIIHADLELDDAGHATWIEDRLQFDGTPVTYTTNYTYEIRGAEVEFETQPCPPNAICAGPPHGTISPITGDLDVEIGRFESLPIIYHFRRLALP
ncbi:MAG: hypothetical protein ACJ78M_03960, partial [Gemmatimonadaceae bacterium]